VFNFGHQFPQSPTFLLPNEDCYKPTGSSENRRYWQGDDGSFSMHPTEVTEQSNFENRTPEGFAHEAFTSLWGVGDGDFSYLMNQDQPQTYSPSFNFSVASKIKNTEYVWGRGDEYFDSNQPEEQLKEYRPIFNVNSSYSHGNGLDSYEDHSRESDVASSYGSEINIPGSATPDTEILEPDSVLKVPNLEPDFGKPSRSWPSKTKNIFPEDFLSSSFEKYGSSRDDPTCSSARIPPFKQPSLKTTQQSQPTRRYFFPATVEDAVENELDLSLDMKYWDPSEKPIRLLGSVYDGFSLGKWIVDWTFSICGVGSLNFDKAHRFWTLHLKLAGKMKYAEKNIKWIWRQEDENERLIVEDFIKAGERLVRRIKDLLRECEPAMKKTAKKGDLELGRPAAVMFVKMFFGKKYLLEKTDSLINSLDIWNLRYDANCEETLRKFGI
jgi:hypothetical protein